MTFTFSRYRATQNYMAASHKEHPDHLITVFINNGFPMHVPCPDPINLSDERTLEHLKLFYQLNLFEQGPVRALVPKTLASVDIVELIRGRVAGRRIETLPLGFDGNREVMYFNNTLGLKGSTAIVEQLWRKGVYRCRKPDCCCSNNENMLEAQESTDRCLNMVMGWNGSVASVIILAPTLLSMAAMVVWPAVAVKVCSSTGLL
ncbi:hypothetical protein B0T14DRAFT_552732 [Immersiella caudata]|uniref:Uncharacterized protein n=1 Tax=Immersiella caudata TaxID=314043 RepID=A0AA40C715_9PEZI|nr:hypothetical protein B0T14DRAFT_552732 [Immersiella caudata]